MCDAVSTPSTPPAPGPEIPPPTDFDLMIDLEAFYPTKDFLPDAILPTALRLAVYYRNRLAAAESARDADQKRTLVLEAQVFKMAEWLLVEKRVAEDTIAEDEVPDGMADAFRQRIADIESLLSGSAGESHLADLSSALAAATAERDEMERQRDGVIEHLIPKADRIADFSERRLTENKWGTLALSVGRIVHLRKQAESALAESRAAAGRPVSKEGRPMNRRHGRMVQASELVKEIQDIMEKFGDTCFYVTGLAWGSVALWEQSDYDALAAPEPEKRNT